MKCLQAPTVPADDPPIFAAAQLNSWVSSFVTTFLKCEIVSFLNLIKSFMTSLISCISFIEFLSGIVKGISFPVNSERVGKLSTGVRSSLRSMGHLIVS